MAKKKNQNKPKAKPQIAPKVEITPEIVISSESKEEFEKNKQDFIDNFLADIQKLEKEKGKCWLERKGCFIQEASNVGRRRIHVQKPTLKILLNHESF